MAQNGQQVINIIQIYIYYLNLFVIIKLQFITNSNSLSLKIAPNALSLS